MNIDNRLNQSKVFFFHLILQQSFRYPQLKINLFLCSFCQDVKNFLSSLYEGTSQIFERTSSFATLGANAVRTFLKRDWIDVGRFPQVLEARI